MTLARFVMVESGLGGQFWFSAAMAAKDARNVTYKERIQITPYLYMYKTKKDISKFRVFGCQAYMYLNEERRGKGKHIPRAVEAINLGFATEHNISGYKLYIPSSRKIVISNEVLFDELRFPYRKQAIIDQNNEDTQTNILSRVPSGAAWVQYDKSLPARKYQTAHNDPKSDALILRLVDKTDTYTKTTQQQYFRDVLSVQQAFVASLRVVQGLPDTIESLTQTNLPRITKMQRAGLITRNGQRHIWMKTWDSRSVRFSQQFHHQRGQKSWVGLRVSTTRSTMVC
jgi:hypothetical protein